MDPLPDLTGRVAPIAGGGTTTLDRAPIAGRRARFPHRAAHRPELRQAAVAVCETVSQAALRELAEEVGAADEVTSIHSVPLADLDVEPRLTAIPQSDAPVISLPLLGGSAALLVTTSERARELGLTPIVRVHTTVVVADDPVVMLTAPVPATRRVLQRSGLALADIGVFEVDEAFAPEEESLDALSMPRLAAQLDVGVTSIYWYFKSKEDLLDALTEQAMVQFYAELHVPAGLAWEEHLREFFREFRRVFQANKVLNDLIITRTGNVTEKAFTAAFERVEEVLRALVDAGFTRDDAMYGYSALSVYTRGALFIERGYQAAEKRPTVRRPTSDGLAHIPLISDVASRHTLVMTDEDDVEFGLENAIRGLQVLLAEHRAGQPEPSAS